MNISFFFKRYEYCLVFFLMVVTFFVRFLLVADNKFLFSFDQSRDAYLSRQIVEHQDLKLQGPSASGTNDSVYHGVLHYYLIGPAYSLSGGNPYIPEVLLLFLSTFTIIPLYFLTKSLANGSIFAGVISSVMFSFSFQAAELAAWLANPSYSLFTITLFYYALWQVFFKHKHKWLVVLMLALGLSTQSVISLTYLWVSVFAAFYFQKKHHPGESIFKNKKLIILSIVIYVLSISSMILTQLLLLYHGISPISSIASSANGVADVTTAVTGILSGYANIIALSLFPTTLTFSFIISVIVFYLIRKSADKQKILFFLIWFLSPFAVLIVNPPMTRHLLIAIVPLMYILFSLCLSEQFKSSESKVVVSFLIILSLLSNSLALIQIHKTHSQFFHLQKGALLKDELAAIDYTYKNAHNQPFSISTLTIPYGYNTTWAYLYNWYGKEKYGYVPTFYGPSQDGIFAGSFLASTPAPLGIHYSIYEPAPTVSSEVMDQFNEIQTLFAGSPAETKNFSSITVLKRQK